MKKRFVYYLIFINMVSNIVAQVPKTFQDKSAQGALISMAIGSLAGILLIWIIEWLFGKFPGRTLNDLMKEYLPRWYTYPVLIYLAANWFFAGLIILASYTFLLIRFLTPEMSIYIIIGTFVAFLTYAVVCKSKSILYTIETIFVCLSPMIVFLLVKILLNKQMKWDYVGVAVMHGTATPDYSAMMATIFIFMGVVNIAYFNLFLNQKLKMSFWNYVFIWMVGVIILAFIYFIPFGYAGYNRGSDLIYPWIMTSDSVQMKYGFVERFVFIFMLNFLAVAFLNIMVHWHIAARFLSSLVSEKVRIKKLDARPFLFAVLFWAISFPFIVKITEYDLFKFSTYFYNQMPLFALLLVGTLLLIRRNAKRRNER